jgi:hypothetical protein
MKIFKEFEVFYPGNSFLKAAAWILQIRCWIAKHLEAVTYLPLSCSQPA